MKKLLITVAGSLLLLVGNAQADQVILDDLIVDGSACIGFDCVNGESFGFDTIRIKENNLRIRAVDTSSTASFPSNDWQITFNDSSNGGANKFSIDDIDGGRTPFTIEAGAPDNSLYVDDGGRLGLGTSTPVVDAHIVSGNTPTLRLEQNGSSGFTPQTWDVAGNEANFFIRDATNGSTLPFRIRPGAPSSAIDVSSSGDVGFGSTDILASHINVDGGSDNQAGLKLCHNGSGACNGAASGDGANFTLFGDDLFITNRASGDLNLFTNNAAKLLLAADDNHQLTGNLTISGDCTETDGACAPDYVFEADYKMMTLDELEVFIKQNKHLPNVPKGATLDKKGINVIRFSYTLLEKIEELTLYTLEQQQTIAQLQADLKKLGTN